MKISEFVQAIIKKRDNSSKKRLERRQAKLYRRSNRSEISLKRKMRSRLKKSLVYKRNKEKMLQKGLTPTGRRRVIYTK